MRFSRFGTAIASVSLQVDKIPLLTLSTLYKAEAIFGVGR